MHTNFSIPDSSSLAPTDTLKLVVPASPTKLISPISGFVSSLYTFIVFAPDLFPASSIAFTVMAYSPSVCTFILVFISSTLF